MKRIPFSILVFILSFAGPGLRASAQFAISGEHTQPSQKASTTDTPSIDDLDAQVPVIKPEFTPAGVVPGVSGAFAFTTPIVCSSEGVPYVSFLDSKGLGVQAVTSLDPKGGHIFSVQQIQGLYGIQNIHGVLANDSMVGLLVNATKDSSNPQTIKVGKDLPPLTTYPGEHKDFLAEFDLKGNFTKVVELELPEGWKTWRLAFLSDGSLLAAAYDHINARPHLVIFGSGGEKKQDLKIPEELADDPVFMGGAGSDISQQVQAASGLNSWKFALAMNKVLLYQLRSNTPILEVGAGGTVREVTIEHPKGYVIEGVLPSNDRWLIRFRKEGVGLRGLANTDPTANIYLLYEVNPGDGSLRRRIAVTAAIFYSASCEKDGKITAFTVEDEKIKLTSTDLGK